MGRDDLLLAIHHSSSLAALLGRAASGQDYTPLLGGESAKALAKRPPHNTDPTLIFYTLRVYTIRRSATFLDIGFLGFSLYIYLSLDIFLMVQCILNCPVMPSASFVDLSSWRTSERRISDPYSCDE